ncbi:DNA helicase IV [Nocardiopsis sp. Huas11]|uniref:HelD family protein n=1 Tax=Nocardiopsis sp. Huas11 TaxID=2183912 RepID=UPI000EB0F3F6|nr:ATP-binding domain-containing protein [Nocardiopsis sp. Huas11]RKS08389.1 DNA helicase IV [Nocardiopsis sp. Huas11]
MTASVPAPDPLQAERAYLARARSALGRMYEDVVNTPTVQDSSEDADYTFTNRQLVRYRERRAEALVDFPDVPLFFGRLDYPPGTVFEAHGTDRNGTDQVYIGRRHVHDSDGTPLVLDWRARISSAFYRATRQDPRGVLLRRRYGFSEDADLTAYEDEPLTSANASDGSPGTGAADRLLAAEIERPRSGPMRDIVATIQPEQDELVRAPLRPALCVQGAPGTGKTAVGLHRIAYLLFTERDRLRQDGGVVIVGPHRSFLSYIRNVLPALGEVGVRQSTIEDLIGGVPVRRAEEAEAERIKGGAHMAQVIERALWDQVRPLEETLVVERGSRKWRLHPEEVAEALTELRGRGIAYGAGPNLLSQRLAHLVMRRIESAGDAGDTGTIGHLRRTKALTAAVRHMWPKTDPARLVLGLLTHPDRLGRAAEGILTAEEQDAIRLPGRPRTPKSARWSVTDLALIDEAAALIERPGTLGHIVIDEAQDLSPMQARAIARRCTRGSLTVLGDIAQGTSPGAVGDWTELLEHLGEPDARPTVLDRGFRTPAQIIDYAARLLPEIAPGLGTPTGVRDVPGALRVTATDPADLPAALALACREALKGEGSIGLVAADADLPDLREHLSAEGLRTALIGETEDAMETDRLVCVPATLAKGLEFDIVVVAEPAHIVAAEPRGLHRLYVALTRAVSHLHIIHSEALPTALENVPVAG